MPSPSYRNADRRREYYLREEAKKRLYGAYAPSYSYYVGDEEDLFDHNRLRNYLARDSSDDIEWLDPEDNSYRNYGYQIDDISDSMYGDEYDMNDDGSYYDTEGREDPYELDDDFSGSFPDFSYNMRDNSYEDSSEERPGPLVYGSKRKKDFDDEDSDDDYNDDTNDDDDGEGNNGDDDGSADTPLKSEKG